MAEELIEELIMELLRRKRKVTKKDILDMLMESLWARPPTPREIEMVMRVLRRLEITLGVLRIEEIVRGPIKRYIWYYAIPLRRLVTRRPGQKLTKREISQYYGLPLEEIDRVIEILLRRKWIRPTETVDVYQIPARIYRVQKMRAWRTRKRPELYQVRFGRTINVPMQMVLEGFAPSQDTLEMRESVHGAIRIVVYTTSPESWPESRLERIMRGLFAQERITVEIFKTMDIEVSQAYEFREIDLDEKPPEIDLDEPDVWLWIAKDDGRTFAYHYTRRPWGWTYEKYEVK